jgi:hypothetical protein
MKIRIDSGDQVEDVLAKLNNALGTYYLVFENVSGERDDFMTLELKKLKDDRYMSKDVED